MSQREMLAQLLGEVEQLRLRLARAEAGSHEPIAVVGLACRLPGASDSEQFWRLLCDGRDPIAEVPRDRWDVDACYAPAPGAPGKAYCRVGGFVDDVGGFDAAAFGISPRELRSMDPQQRLLLEVAREALEDAGIAPGSLRRTRTGVFVGIGIDDYAKLQEASGADLIDPHAGTGTGFCFAAGRLAYHFGLQGPALALDTACSSSLTAVHLALRSLRSGESDLALAGGVNLMLAPAVTLYLSGLGALSPSGRCRSFDAGADGYVRAEGCGLVVLERLCDARARGHRVLALLRGSAVNHDGPSSGLTIPSGPAQREVIRAALADACVDADSVDYIEAHGTGTALGDPIEVRALREAFAARSRPLLLGSVKTNIGHLETAAGIAGLIKVVLGIQRDFLPGQLHFERANPALELGPLEVAARSQAWPAGGGRRRAGVSAFGLSGTNVHVIVEQAPEPEPAEPTLDAAAELLIVSAHTPSALERAALRLADRLEADPALALRDVAQTLRSGRDPLASRLAIVASSTAEAVRRLRKREEWIGPARVESTGSAPRVAFLFTGQGAQYPGMGEAAWLREPAYREVFERCDALARRELDLSLVDAVYGARDERAAARLQQTGVAQPALFAVELATTALWRSWGIHPALVLGHSVGEYAAAVVAGACSLEQGFALVAARARAMQQLATGPGEGGAMLAVRGPAQRLEGVEALVLGRLPALCVAAYNSPEELVLSGDAAAIEQAALLLAERGVACRRLRVSHAFHSPAMVPAADAVARAADARGGFAAPSVPWISALDARLVDDQTRLDAERFRRHVLAPVRMRDALVELGRHAVDVLIEVGPAPVLLAHAAKSLPEFTGPSLASLRADRPADRSLSEALGRLWLAGAAVSWPAVGAARGGRTVGLPATVFERQRHWIAGPSRSRAGQPTSRSNPVLGRRLASPLGPVCFESELSTDGVPILGDHVVYGVPVVSGPTLLACMIEGATELLGRHRALVLRDVAFLEAILLPAGTVRVAQFVFEPAGADRWRVAVHSRPAGSEGLWSLHATATLEALEQGRAADAPASESIAARLANRLDGATLYRDVQTRVGFEFGDSFLWIDQLWNGPGEALGRMRPSRPADELDRYRLHPGLHDACFQVFGAASEAVMELARSEAVIPVGVDELRYVPPVGAAPPEGERWCHARLWPGQGKRDDMFAGDFTLHGDPCGTVEVRGLRLRRAERRVMMRALRNAGAPPCLRLHWVEAPPQQAKPAAWLAIGDEAAALELAGAAGGIVAGAGAPLEALVRSIPDLAGVVWIAPTGEPSQLAASAAAVIHGLAHADLRVPLVLATRGALEVSAADVPRLGDAAVWGVGRVAALELPELHGGLVDLPAAPTPADWRALSTRLSALPEPELAIRDARAWLPRLRPLEPPLGAAEPVRLSEQSCYLVTGAFGALGSLAARWLVEAGARELVLVSRSVEGAHADRLRAELCELAPGLRLRSMAVDLALPGACAALIESVDAERSPLAGVIHAAGVLDDGALLELGRMPARFESVFGAKVGGAVALDRALADRSLAFFVLYGSAAGLLGSAGQANYAAANACLDALAVRRRRRGLHATSIQWGAWAEVGMAARARQRGARAGAAQSARGVRALDSATGRQVLLDPAVLAGRGPSTLAVIDADWSEYRDLVGPRQAIVGELGAGRAARAGAIRGELARRLERAPVATRPTLLSAHLREVLSRVLELSSDAVIDERGRFFELGLDSLMAIELKNGLQRELDHSLPPTLILDHPSIHGLTGHLLALLFDSAAPEAAVPARVELAHDEVLAVAIMSDAEAEQALMAELGERR